MVASRESNEGGAVGIREDLDVTGLILHAPKCSNEPLGINLEEDTSKWSFGLLIIGEGDVLEHYTSDQTQEGDAEM